tara:strand:+ start:1503 stop:1733 length:231 start_codon:yes stop_codon:yes gene_type:complete
MPKDACYKKVKARYKVFPSAYASGAIAKCRKVGASNWGESSKKRKRKVKKKLRDGGFIARGCGTVQESKRKETRTF